MWFFTEEWKFNYYFIILSLKSQKSYQIAYKFIEGIHSFNLEHKIQNSKIFEVINLSFLSKIHESFVWFTEKYSLFEMDFTKLKIERFSGFKSKILKMNKNLISRIPNLNYFEMGKKIKN